MADDPIPSTSDRYQTNEDSSDESSSITDSSTNNLTTDNAEGHETTKDEENYETSIDPHRYVEKGEAVTAAAADNCKSGIIRFDIDKISTLDEEGIFSPEIEVGGVSWRGNVYKTNGGPDGSSLAIGISSMQKLWPKWRMDVDVQFILVHSDETKSISIERPRSFGYKDELRKCHILPWEEFIDNNKGFINGDKIVVEIRFTILRMTDPFFDFTNSNDSLHDIVLILNGEKIYASKAILSLHSPVFHAMFYRDFNGKNENVFELKNIDKDEFLEMLHVIYPSRKNITEESTEFLLKLADRFQIAFVITRAEEFLIASSKMSYMEKLRIAYEYKLVGLQYHCLFNLKAIHHSTIIIRVENVKALEKDGVKSEIKRIDGFPWMAVACSGEDNSLSVRLSCLKSEESELWECEVEGDVKLINHDDDSRSICKMFKERFETRSSPHSLGMEFREIAVNDMEDVLDNENFGFMLVVKIVVKDGNGVRFRSRSSNPDFFSPSKLSNVILLVEGKKLYVSKQILAHSSPVFEALFFGKFSESQKREIELKDVSIGEFIITLELIYETGKIDENNMEHILKLADRFDIPKIIIAASSYIINDGWYNNAPSYFQHLYSEQYNLNTLQVTS